MAGAPGELGVQEEGVLGVVTLLSVWSFLKIASIPEASWEMEAQSGEWESPDPMGPR